MALTFQPLSIRPRHLLRLLAGTILALALASCGSDGEADNASATSLAEDATATAEGTTISTAPSETTPPETDPPTDDSDGGDTGTGSPNADICVAWETLGGHLDELDGPPEDTDFEAVWDSIQEAATELTKASPEGYEDELSRMEQAWGEFRVVAREHDFDMDAADDDLELIAENLDLEEPEIVDYLLTECTS